jgi:polysaccharide export outer membrane protein
MIMTSKDRIEMKMSKVSVGFAGLVLLAALAIFAAQAWGTDDVKTRRTPEVQTKTAPPHVSDDYVIGPSDVLAINVWKDAELSRTVLVRPDGRISLPLVGELEVSGLTALKVQDLIAQKLSPYVSKPQVTVIVTEVKSRTYTIVGKIAHPGSFELGKPTTVLEATAIAGGFLDFAKVNKIYVIRRLEDGSQTRLPFDYKKVIGGRKADENIDLKGGDIIVVP